jgi:activator of HSP90 ATPase
MVLHNPNNWHWVSKDVSGSAKAFLEKELVGISAEEGDVTAKIDSVLSMDGDVDVSQRKGKVITIFDVKLQLEWSGQFGLNTIIPPVWLTIIPGTAKDVSASGTITIPEVAHDTEEDEYVVCFPKVMSLGDSLGLTDVFCSLR